MIPAVLLSLAATFAQVELRAGEALPAPEVIAMSAAGITLGSGGQSVYLVGWDRVLSVDPPTPEATAHLALGERLWRARTRLERGDAVAAEPIFDELAPSLLSLGGPMPAEVAEGLLRCRLRRGAQTAAIEPWIQWLAARSRPSPDGTVGYATDWAARAGLDPVMDPGTGLIPAVPPMWLDWPAIRVYATAPGLDSGDLTPPISAKANALSRLYLHAARFEAGIPEPFPTIVSAGDPGVAVVLDIVLARTGDAGDRAGARSRLTDRLGPASDTWLEAWCRAAIGRSLILEAEDDARRLGIVELLHLPARFADAHPYLAGLCLAEASATLTDLGDAAGASALRAELLTRYPEHAVVAWERVRIPGATPISTGGSHRSGAPRVIPLANPETPSP